jgi:hypothetical protein
MRVFPARGSSSARDIGSRCAFGLVAIWTILLSMQSATAYEDRFGEGRGKGRPYYADSRRDSSSVDSGGPGRSNRGGATDTRGGSDSRGGDGDSGGGFPGPGGRNSGGDGRGGPDGNEGPGGGGRGRH